MASDDAAGQRRGPADEDGSRAGRGREAADEDRSPTGQGRGPVDEGSATASERRDPAGADRVTALERRSRRLLRVYPAAYRHERAEEMIGTLLEATPDGRSWPRLRDVRALVTAGLKARAAQNRQRTASVNLRVALMVGISLWLALQAANFLVGVVSAFVPNSARYISTLSMAVAPTGWSAALSALLTASTVLLAWTAPRVIVLAGALAASAAVMSFALANRSLIGPYVLWVLCLAALVALAPRPVHSSPHWLWPLGLMVIALPLAELGVGYGWLRYNAEPLTSGALVLGIAVAGIVWIGMDARLMVAVLTFLAVAGVQLMTTAMAYGSSVLGALQFVLVIAAIAAPAIWLLRRQSGPAGRTT
jgi:hypothetical protein